MIFLILNVILFLINASTYSSAVSQGKTVGIVLSAAGIAMAIAGIMISIVRIRAERRIKKRRW